MRAANNYMSNGDALELVELLIMEDGWSYKRAFEEFRHQTGSSMASAAIIYRYLRDKYSKEKP